VPRASAARQLPNFRQFVDPPARAAWESAVN
jgi:hypothetical protein